MYECYEREVQLNFHDRSVAVLHRIAIDEVDRAVEKALCRPEETLTELTCSCLQFIASYITFHSKIRERDGKGHRTNRRDAKIEGFVPCRASQIAVHTACNILLRLDCDEITGTKRSALVPALLELIVTLGKQLDSLPKIKWEVIFEDLGRCKSLTVTECIAPAILNLLLHHHNARPPSYEGGDDPSGGNELNQKDVCISKSAIASLEALLSVWLRSRNLTALSNTEEHTHAICTELHDLLCYLLQGLLKTGRERERSGFCAVLKIVTKEFSGIENQIVRCSKPIKSLPFLIPMWLDMWSAIFRFRNSRALKSLAIFLASILWRVFPAVYSTEVLSSNMSIRNDPLMDCHPSIDLVYRISCGAALEEDWATCLEALDTMIVFAVDGPSECLADFAPDMIRLLGSILDYSSECNKSLQYSALLSARALLDTNIYTRSFDLMASKEATYLKFDEAKSAAFVHAFDEHFLPSLVKLFQDSRVNSIASRTLKLVETILFHNGIAFNPNNLIRPLLSPNSLSSEAHNTVVRVLKSRCSSTACLLEICHRYINRLLCTGKAIVPDDCSELSAILRYVLDSTETSKVMKESIGILRSILCSEDPEIRIKILSVLMLISVLVNESSFEALHLSVEFQLMAHTYLQTQDRDADISLSTCVELSLWLRLIAIVGRTFHSDIKCTTLLKYLEAELFPWALGNRGLRSAAVSLALAMPRGLDVLFHSIGIFQDDALLSESTSADSVAQYLELLEATIIEHSNTIRASVRNDLKRRLMVGVVRKCATGATHEESSKSNSLSFRKTKGSKRKRTDENLDLIMKSAIAFDDSEDTADPIADPSVDSGQANEVYSYMRRASLIESSEFEEARLLEDSVLNDGSFLGCFLPFVKALCSNIEVDCAIRVASIRVLEQYMLISPKQLSECIPTIERIILSPCEMVSVSASEESIQSLCLQALSTWVRTFRNGASSGALLCQLSCSYYLCIKDGTSSRWSNHMRYIYASMLSLIMEGHIRNPEYFGIVLAVGVYMSSLARLKVKNKDAQYCLLELMRSHLKLLPRLVFWIMGDSTAASDPNHSPSSDCSQVLLGCLAYMNEEKEDINCFSLRFAICKVLVECISKQDVTKRRRNRGKVILNALLDLDEKITNFILDNSRPDLIPFLGLFPISVKSSALISRAMSLGFSAFPSFKMGDFIAMKERSMPPECPVKDAKVVESHSIPDPEEGLQSVNGEKQKEMHDTYRNSSQRASSTIALRSTCRHRKKVQIPSSSEDDGPIQLDQGSSDRSVSSNSDGNSDLDGVESGSISQGHGHRLNPNAVQRERSTLLAKAVPKEPSYVSKHQVPSEPSKSRLAVIRKTRRIVIDESDDD